MLSGLLQVQKIAQKSKFGRLLHNPSRYLHAILFRELVYTRSKQEKVIMTDLFFGGQMMIGLPASTDIYLTGGKSHDSEIRLAKYMINTLTPEDTFIDIGAHYGYYSILAAKLIGKNGHVFSIEPSPQSFSILLKNQNLWKDIQVFNSGMSDEKTTLTFYQFPNYYSEYNSFDISQYQDAQWFSHNPPKEIKIESTTLDDFILEKNSIPTFIKIDVEGFEDKVISGGKSFLSIHAPIVVMEFVSSQRHNEPHQIAQALLSDMGYQAFIMDENADLHPVDDINAYLTQNNFESDNIVFQKI